MLADGVLHVELARGSKRNAMGAGFWGECARLFGSIGRDGRDVRVVLLTGEGPAFSAGLDLTDMLLVAHDDPGRRGWRWRAQLLEMQDAFTAIERCPAPVLALVHGACIGAGLDMVCAADIRWCTSDAYFVAKEVDLGLAADVGTLQRLPAVVGSRSLVNELVITARRMPAAEACACGLVSATHESKAAMMDAALRLAGAIAAKSPLAVAVTKRALLFSRDHPNVADGLEDIATLNAFALQSGDLAEAAAAVSERRQPVYSRL